MQPKEKKKTPENWIFLNRQHWQSEVGKNSIKGCFRLLIDLFTNKNSYVISYMF